MSASDRSHRFAVLGAGALGSIIAAKLLQAGFDVQLIARGRRASQLHEHGLRISGELEATLACEPVADPRKLKSVDTLIVTVKAYDTEAAIEPLRGMDLDTVFSVANGVVKNEQLAAVFGAEAVLGCMSDISGELRADGEVVFTRNVGLSLGALTPYQHDRAQTLARSIENAGIPCPLRENIESVEWSKYIGWMGAMVVSVLTRATTGRFLADPDGALITARLMRETAALARARNIELIDQSPIPTASICAGSEGDAVNVVQELGAKFTAMAPEHRMSALQDLERGRALEIEPTLGYAIGLAAQNEIAVPTLESCYRLVRALDRLR